MSRGRFALLLALLVSVLATATFLVVLRLLDDPTAAAPTTTTTTSSSSTVPPDAAGLPTPTFVAIVSSNTDEGDAIADAAELTERGYDGAVLRSDDHSSLEPGFWVAYVGPFDDATGAQAATDDLIADGYDATYPRCVGTADECS